MNEIEKMYENCNIIPKQEGYCGWDCDCPYPDIINSGCGDECPYWEYEDEAKYPPFTAEKQLELIKWLARKGLIQINYSSHQCYQFNSFRVGGDYKTDISEALASHCNNLWQDLTEEERKQVKGILE